MSDYIVQTKGIAKEFSSVRVLRDISICVKKGEVYGIIGENGAGKSTLMKILGGIYQPTQGRIFLKDQEVHFRSPRHAMQHGISMIHQELNLVDELTVADNIFLGREKTRNFMIDTKESAREASSHLSKLKSAIEPGIRLKELSVAEKQIVEIAKAVSQSVEVLIMDEPTSVLTQKEIDALFELIRDLKSQGITVFYISHKLNEVVDICERITVLRDGRLVATKNAREVSVHDLANLMVGREINDYYPSKGISGKETVFEVNGFSVGGRVHDVSFSLKRGEILGFFGLIGAGRTELAEAIMGLRKKDAGTITLNGHDIDIRSAGDAIANRMAYLSEDRHGRALITPLNVVENTTLISLKRYCRPFIAKSEEKKKTWEYVDRLKIKVNRLENPLRTLSGGNQQKVAFAKWLEVDPHILILDEPTRGIDVNAKREIYTIIKELAEEGRSCIIISSELSELLGMCHRIIVMRNGSIAGEVHGSEATEEAIMYYATGIGQRDQVA